MSIEASMLSWLEGGCLSTPSTPLVSAPARVINPSAEVDDQHEQDPENQ